MEYHKELVRCVVRAFYETEHIVIIDTLVTHYALSVSDLALVLDLGTQVKIVQKICAKLKEAGLVSTHSRQEIREGATKPISREYFFIDYRHAIDATKYRIHMIDERIKRDAKPTTEKKEYECTTCGADWTVIDVLDNPDPSGRGSGFLCKRCNNPLTFCSADDTVQDQDDRPSLFNRQFGRLLGLLQRIDESSVPEMTGEQAVADSIPIPRDEHLNPAMRTQVVTDQYVKPSAVRGMNNTTSQIEVSIMTDKESSAAELTAAAEQRAKLAAQNALPSWYTHSTVTGEATVANASLPPDTAAASEAALPGSVGQAVEDNTRDPNLDAYFATLKAEQERKAQEESDEDDEDDDDDEFEDVPTGAQDTLADEQPASKRVKTEDIASIPNPPPPVPPSGNTVVDDGEDEDDDDEFEDVV